MTKQIIVAVSLFLGGIVVGAGITQVAVLPGFFTDLLASPYIQATDAGSGEIKKITVANALSQLDQNQRYYLTDLANLIMKECGSATSTNEIPQ